MRVCTLLLLVLMLIVCSFACKKKAPTTGSVIPPNPPNALCPIDGKWTQVPNVYVDDHADIATHSPPKLVKDVMKRVSADTPLRFNRVSSVASADVEIKYYTEPWVVAQKGVATVLPMPGGCRVQVDRVSDKAASDTTITNWPQPNGSENLSGLTYLRIDARGQIVKALIWLNLYPLVAEPQGRPTAFERTTAHELGHVGGLNHATQPNNLMWASSGGQSAWWSALEFALWRWLYG